MKLTPAGERDPVFGPLGPGFPAQIGHEDIVTELPAGAVLLASSETVENEAFCFLGRPIYATQFHPELDRAGLIARIARYPVYLPLTGASTIEEFRDRTPETPEAESLLPRFLAEVLGEERVGEEDEMVVVGEEDDKVVVGEERVLVGDEKVGVGQGPDGTGRDTQGPHGQVLDE